MRVRWPKEDSQRPFGKYICCCWPLFLLNVNEMCHPNFLQLVTKKELVTKKVVRSCSQG